MSIAEFNAARLKREAEVAGQAFGFDDAAWDEGHDRAASRLMWWTGGGVAAVLAATLFLI